MLLLSTPAVASSFGDLTCDDSVNVTDVQLSIIVALGMPLSEVLDADKDGTPDACPAEVSCGVGTVLEGGVCTIDQAELDIAFAKGYDSGLKLEKPVDISRDFSMGKPMDWHSGTRTDKPMDTNRVDGKEDGEDLGYTAGQADGYQQGFFDGKADGLALGYADGQTDGYQQDFSMGKQTVWTWIHQRLC